MKNILIIMFIALGTLVFADTIHLTNETKIPDVKVAKENYDTVSYYIKGSNSAQNVSQDKIKEIERDEIPYNFQVAQTYFDQKNYDQAIKDYFREARNKTWTEQHCLFRIAESYRLMGDSKKAIDAYEDLIKRIPQGRYLPECYYYIGETFFKDKKWNLAGRSYEKAAGIYKKIGKRKEEVNCNYKLALSLEKGNKSDIAIRIYKDLVREKDIAEEVSLHLGLCYLNEKNYRDAKRQFLQTIKMTDDNQILSGVYVGLGNYYLNGNAENDAKKALFCYLRVVMVYAINSEDMANAYEGAASCFKILKDNGRARYMEQQAAKWKGQ